MTKNLPTILAAILIIAAISFATVMVSAFFRMELQERHERSAVRAALRGDCEGALKWSERAGRVPYDVRRICTKEP